MVTSIHHVSCHDIEEAEPFLMADLMAVCVNSITSVDTVDITTIVHYARVVIRDVRVDYGVGVTHEVMLFVFVDVLPQNCDVVVAVRSVLLMVETHGVAYFVHDDVWVKTVICQADNLTTTLHPNL